MNNSEFLGNPEHPGATKEQLLEIIDASENMRPLHDIVASKEFDMIEAQGYGVRLSKNLDDYRKQRWATLKFKEESGITVARLTQSFPYVVRYSIPEEGRIDAWRSGQEEKESNFVLRAITKLSLSRLLKDLEVS